MLPLSFSRRLLPAIACSLMVCLQPAAQPTAGAGKRPAARLAARSAGIQDRTYDILIDGRPAGHYTLHIANADNTCDVLSSCTVEYSLLFYHYRYRYNGHEQWRDDKISAFNSDSTDQGKRCLVEAKAGPDGIALNVNGKERATASGDSQPSSYWQLPVAPATSGSVNFFEVDSGRQFKGNFAYQGEGTAQVGGKSISCFRYQLTGGDSGDFLYDQQQKRLIQQSFKDSGHQTVVRLVDVTNSTGGI